jgi:hypothetical protein
MTLLTKYPTLLDVAKRLDPNGKIDGIAEVINQTNEIMADIPMIEGNLPTGHKSTIRTDIPKGTWRKLNYGVQPQKSTTGQVTDSVGLLSNISEIDKDIADLNGNTAEFRASEDRPIMAGLGETYATTLFYGDTATNQERFNGFASRFSTLNGSYVVSAGGASPSANTSIWLVVWGSETVFGMYPKGAKAGLDVMDRGIVELTDAAGGKFLGYSTYFNWKCGLVVKDWRSVGRIANIDVAAMATVGDSADSSANILKLMTRVYNQVKNKNMGNPVWYMNTTMKSMLEISLQSKSNVLLSMGDYMDQKDVLKFKGAPIRTCDLILDTENVIS